MTPVAHARSRPWFIPDSLPGRLGTLLVALTVLAAGAATWIEVARDRNLAIDRARAELQAQVDLVAERLKGAVEARARAVSLWPGLQVAQDLAIDDLDLRLSQSLTQLVEAFDGVDVALGVDAAGVALSSSEFEWVGRALTGTPLWDGRQALQAETSPLAAARLLAAPQGTPAFPDSVLLVVSAPVRAAADGSLLGWIVLVSSWSQVVRGAAGPLLPRFSMHGPDLRAWGEAPEGVDALVAERELFIDPLGGLTATLTRPLSTVLAPLRSTVLRLLALAGVIVLALVPPMLLLTRATTRELRGLSLEAADLDAVGRSHTLKVSEGAPAEVRVLAEALRDMVDRLNASRQALARQESLAAVGMLAAGLAHEIRTPLAVLQGSADLLDRKIAADAPERELVVFIQEEVGRLARLVEDLLVFARPRTPECAAVRLDRIAERAASAMDATARDAGIDLRTSLAPAVAWADEGQAYQVLLNVLANAIHATPAGRAIQVRTHEDAERAWIEIEDQGTGIRPEDLERIWEPLFTTRRAGTGLGLAIVKRIVDDHGGAVTVESRLGEGSCFRIALPRPEESLRELEA
ncbi:MAG: ATP-binding protein [Gemmatimonadota bacterium]